jgi:hypothetical protein
LTVSPDTFWATYLNSIDPLPLIPLISNEDGYRRG